MSIYRQAGVPPVTASPSSASRGLPFGASAPKSLYPKLSDGGFVIIRRLRGRPGVPAGCHGFPFPARDEERTNHIDWAGAWRRNQAANEKYGSGERRFACQEQTCGAYPDPRRGGRVAEGGGLLNRYTLSRRIEGSNPSLSATAHRSRPRLRTGLAVRRRPASPRE